MFLVIARAGYQSRVREALTRAPIVSLLGPRQVGKTTLARMVAAGRRAVFFDLENPADLARLSAPMQTLEPLRGLVVIDEIQRLPGLFEILRVLADRPRTPARFLILGSADPRLVRGVSESLAGRVSHAAGEGGAPAAGPCSSERGRDRCRGRRPPPFRRPR